MSYAQRDTPALEKLCIELVQHHCGELAARVFSVLARYGRQDLKSIARYSYLNTRQSRLGMSILVQENLVFHTIDNPNSTFYEIDWVTSYGLVRHGSISELVHQRFGKRAAHVVSILLSMGQTTMDDLREAYFPTPDHDSDDEGGRVNGVLKPNGVKTNGTSAMTNSLTNGHASEQMNGVVQNGVSGMNGLKRRREDGDTGDAEREGAEEYKETPESVEELHAIVYHLMQQGWIMKAEETQHLSPGDIDLMAYDAAKKEVLNGNVPTGTKEKQRLEVATLQQKRHIRDRWTEMPNVQKRKRRRADPDIGRTAKRLKRTAKADRGSGDDEIVFLEPDLTIRLNPDMVTVAMRTEGLVRLVERRVGYVRAKIYQTMLRMIEPHMPRCYEPWPDPPAANPDPDAAPEYGQDPRLLVSAYEVAQKIDRDLNLLDDLDPNTITSFMRSKGHKVVKENRIHPPIHPFELKLADKQSLIHQHLVILAADPFHFVTWYASAGGWQGKFDFEHMARTMIQHEIENTISAAGSDQEAKAGVKLIRALEKKGKLDERGIGNVMMQPVGTVRGVINTLTLQGFLQTQEVPRVDRREAKHSLHLIYYDRQRAREKLLHDIYKAMTRILQRLAFEKEKVQVLLDKANRTDVIGQESKWLNSDELAALQAYKDVEERLTEQLFRQDELVATLRDYTGPLTSS